MSAAPTHRRSRRWLLPLAVVLVWIFVGGPLGSFAGQLSTVQENDNAAFLPESAESTEAQERLVAFSGDESVPATVVFEREGGLTGDDFLLIEQYAEDLRAVENVDSAGVQGPVPSEDGEAAQLVVPIERPTATSCRSRSTSCAPCSPTRRRG